MKHVIIGTSGHIDHGKTSLIKVLTGKETDNLQEEKQRGISINLGFTFFDLPSGKRAGIIDVPGHEKFIKNMLAGATSLDVVLLVIAADEGIMPQTKEHLEILELLNIKRTIIVLTKIDLVDEEWRNMIKDDIKEYLTKTSFENSSIIEISNKTKEGIVNLINEVDKVVEEVEAKDIEGDFRLAVDRCFSVSGYGTVVTGTILSGKISIDDNVIICPKNLNGRVRNIQVHEENVLYGEAGQRCALNLAGIKKEEISRGDTVCTSNIFIPSYIINIKFKYLKSNNSPLVNRQRVRIYHGTSEIIGRVIILNKEKIEPGKDGFVQLRLEKEICVQKGDRIVVRNYSPIYTLGGGVILETSSKKIKRYDEEYINSLKLKECGSIEDIVENSVLEISDTFPNYHNIIRQVGKNIENIIDILEDLVIKRRIKKLEVGDENFYIHNRFFNKKSQDIYNMLSEYHKVDPLKFGMIKEEVRSKCFSSKLKQKIFQKFILLMEERNIIKQDKTYVALDNFSIKLTLEQEKIKNLILSSFKEYGVKPIKFQDIILNEKNKKECNSIYLLLLEQGHLVKISEDIVLHNEVLRNIKKDIIQFIEKNQSINIGEAKEILNTSRKFLVAILEYLDSQKITKREDDVRILYNKFNE